MSRSKARAVIDALLPPGELWRPEPDEGFDLQLDGITDAIEDQRTVVDSLADIRVPSKTPVFTDLERNYGINPNSLIDMDLRIARLEQKVYQGARTNSIDDVQNDLNIAEFDLQVHKNDPPVDPATFLTESFQMVAGGSNAYAGFNDGVNILSFAGRVGGEFLVNPPIISQSKAFWMQAGGSVAYAGYTSDGINSEAVSGYYLSYNRHELTYPVPTDPQFWSKIYFVGGDATRNASGEITAIETGLVDLNRKDDLRTLLLSSKTLGAWAALIISFQ
jgi:hypothetical protein